MPYLTPDPVGPNVELLEQLDQLLARVASGAYRHVEQRLTSSSIGAHVRHVLDHYRLFLEGLPAGRIDYDARDRDTAVERDPAAARREILALVGGLRAIPSGRHDEPLQVHQQGAYEPGRFEGAESRVARELLFLQSHTVHHQALVAVLLRAQGLEVPRHFGIAPSTVAWMERTAAARAAAGTRD